MRRPATAQSADLGTAAQDANQVQTQFALRTNGRTATVPATRWPVYVLVGTGTTVVAAVVLPMFTPLPMIGITIAGAALTALTIVGQIQAQGRASVTAEAKIALERVTGPLGIFRPSRWHGGFVGIPDTLRVKYHPGAVVTDVSWPAPAAAAVSQIFGERYRVAKINKRSGRMKLARDRSAPAAEQPKNPEVERASGLMTQIFGSSAKTKIGLEDEGQLARVEVVHDQKLKASVTAWRDRVDRVVTNMLAGRWRSFWDLENDQVVFELRPKMPRSIVREPLTAADRSGSTFYKAKIGLDEDSNPVLWDLQSSAPHLLLAGKTGKGKCLWVETPIPTPTGWSKIGALEVGDLVFDETGEPRRVLGVYDQPPNRACYEIIFSDGSTIVADEDHRWLTETRAYRVSKSLNKVLAPGRQRRPTLSPGVVARLRAEAAKALPGDVITVHEAAALASLSDTGSIVRRIAAAVGAQRRQPTRVTFTYAAQTVQQRQRVCVYPAKDAYAMLAERAKNGRGRRLPPLAEKIDALAAEAAAHEFLARRDIARSLGVSDSTLKQWLEGVDSHVESQLVTCNVSAKSVTRTGNTTTVYNKKDFLEALAGYGERPRADQRHKRLRPEVHTTTEIRETLHAQNGALNHSIQLAGPLQLPETDLPVRPYTLGCWLGDGDSSGSGFTSADPEVVELIRAGGYKVSPHGFRQGACPRYGIIGIRGLLNGMGILRTKATPNVTKAIPKRYLRASIEQRRALLAGLLDTDGTVSPQGRVQYTSVLVGLAEGVKELAISLGYRATMKVGTAKIADKEYGPAWTVSFTTADAVFRLTRKLEAQRERTARHSPERTRSRYIRDVRPVASRPVRCIEVDSPSHLYLAGRSMIPTHNTNVIRGLAVDLAARGVPVMCGDPKRIELRGLRGWPNVQLVTTSIESIVAMIIHAWRLMEDRYEQIEKDESRVSDFELMVVIVDEYAELSTRINAWWARVKRPGQPSRCPIFEQFDSLVRLGRKAGIRVVVGMQRPDVKFFGETGEARDNFDARISVGRMEPDGSRMMWNSSIGTTLPGIPGRALASTDPDSGVREMQVYYTPDPSEPANDDEQNILDSLRPPAAKWPQLELTIPEPEVDDKGRPMVWESLEASTLEPVEEQDQDTDAVVRTREHERLHAGESSSSVSGAAEDGLLEMAAELVVNLQHASAAMLIRKLRIRHAEALTLLDQLQEYGIVDATDNNEDVTVCYQPDDLPAVIQTLRTQREPTAETAPGTGQEPAAGRGGEVINFPAANRKQPRKANPQKSISDTGTKVSDDPSTEDLINTDRPADTDGVQSGGEEYGSPQPVAACDVQAGDLVLLDDRWVVVEACEPDELEPEQHVIDWRSADDDDDYGALLKPSSEPVMSRQPNDS